MSRFMRSFNEAFQGGTNVVNAWREGQRLSDMRKITEEQPIDVSQYDGSEFQDEAEKSGGVWDAESQSFKMPDGSFKVATNTPTWDENTRTYKDGSGRSLKPKAAFKLGNIKQNRQFTPDEINAYKTERYADVYAANGDAEKAMGLRSNAQQLKLGKVQLEQAEMLAKEAANVRKIMKIQAGFATGELDAEEVIKQIIPITDKANDDGITHSYRPIGDGTFEITEHHNDKVVGSKIVRPAEALNAALKYASPTMLAQAQQQENFDKNYTAGREDAQNTNKYRTDSLAQSADQFGRQLNLSERKMLQDGQQFQTKLDWETAQHNDNMGIKRQELQGLNAYRGAAARAASARPLQLQGVTEDGLGIYLTPDGVETRPLPPGVKGTDLFPKATGIKPGRDMTVGDRIKLNEAVDTALQNDPNFASIVKDPAALQLARQQIEDRLLGVETPSLAPVQYMDLADEIDKEAKPGGLKPKGNWYDSKGPKVPSRYQGIALPPQYQNLGTVPTGKIK